MTVSENTLYCKIKEQLAPYVRKNYLKLKNLCDLNDLKIVIFGAGTYGGYVFDQLIENNLESYVYSFCDNAKSKWGTFFHGKKIYSLDYLMEKNEKYIFVIASVWDVEIKKQLEENKQRIFENSRETILLEKTAIRKDLVFEECPCGSIPYYLSQGQKLYQNNMIREKINQVRDMLEDDISKQILELRVDFVMKTDMLTLGKMYDLSLGMSMKELLPITDDEIFVDCGAFTGDSIQDFLEASGGKYQKIIAFEPDKYNFGILKNYVELNKINANLYPYGVGNENGELNFLSNGTGGACYSNEGDSVLKIVSLDDLLYDTDYVTFLKMDIEGAEMNALKGAKKLIQRDKPKLHISIYHRPEDLYSIPLYIKSLVPEYRFKLAHRTTLPFDTDLYAYVE